MRGLIPFDHHHHTFITHHGSLIVGSVVLAALIGALVLPRLPTMIHPTAVAVTSIGRQIHWVPYAHRKFALPRKFIHPHDDLIE